MIVGLFKEEASGSPHRLPHGLLRVHGIVLCVAVDKQFLILTGLGPIPCMPSMPRSAAETC